MHIVCCPVPCDQVTASAREAQDAATLPSQLVNADDLTPRGAVRKHYSTPICHASNDVHALNGEPTRIMYMYSRGVQLLYALISLLLGLTAAEKTTTVVSITSTTTVHVTATDYSGACDNFVGACVVYGSPYGSAPYTTTVYRYAPTRTPPPPAAPPPPPTTTVITSTTVLYATTTASNSGDCSDFRGACVVYGTGTSTVYYAGSSALPLPAQSQPGNGQGYIGPKEGDSGDGVIGEAPGIQRWTLVAVLGSAVICAILLL